MSIVPLAQEALRLQNENRDLKAQLAEARTALEPFAQLIPAAVRDAHPSQGWFTGGQVRNAYRVLQGTSASASKAQEQVCNHTYLHRGGCTKCASAREQALGVLAATEAAIRRDQKEALAPGATCLACKGEGSTLELVPCCECDGTGKELQISDDRKGSAL